MNHPGSFDARRRRRFCLLCPRPPTLAFSTAIASDARLSDGHTRSLLIGGQYHSFLRYLEPPAFGEGNRDSACVPGRHHPRHNLLRRQECSTDQGDDDRLPVIIVTVAGYRVALSVRYRHRSRNTPLLGWALAMPVEGGDIPRLTVVSARSRLVRGPVGLTTTNRQRSDHSAAIHSRRERYRDAEN